MATFTTNYNLRKPATSDYVTVSTDLDDNLDTIDTELKAVSDVADAASAASTANASAITTLQTAVTSTVDFGSSNFHLKKHFVIVKDADETVNGSTAQQDDNHFFFTVTSGNYYTVEMDLFVTNGSTSNIKVNWNFPTSDWAFGSHALDPTATARTGANALANWVVTTGSASATTGNNSYGCGGNNSPSLIKLYLCFLAAASGTAQFQWTQNTNTAINTTLNKLSSMKVWEYTP